jgi:hypothetical protein
MNAPGIALLDLLSTPVPILDGEGLVTRVGLSAADPLGERHAGEAFRVFLTQYSADGMHISRREIGTLAAGERRIFDVAALLRGEKGEGNRLAVIHRVPESLCPSGEEPATAAPFLGQHAEYELYRAVVEYADPRGGNGSVVYETPPRFNDLRDRPRPQETLSFTSKILISEQYDTLLCLIHYSVDPSYRRTATYRMRVFTDAGEVAATRELILEPFTATVVSMRELLVLSSTRGSGEFRNYSMIAWCRDAAVIPLMIQRAPNCGSVAVEHIHPAQAFLLPNEIGQRNVIKATSIAAWDHAFEAAS